MLFGIALAWAQFPDASSAWNDPATLANRRAAAIDAAKRLLAPPIATFQNNSMEQSGYEVGGLLRIRRELVDLVSGDQVTRR